VFNAKGKREISYEHWRSLLSNLLGNLLVHLLWSWIKEIGVPHARARSLAAPRRASRGRARGCGRGRGRGHGVTWRDVTSGRTNERTWCVAGREHLFAVDDPLMVNVTVGCQWPLNRDSYQEPLNRDRYLALTATVTTWGALTVTSTFIPLRLLLAYIRRPPPLPQVANSQTRYSCLGDLSLLPLFAAFFCISIACTTRTVSTRAEPPEPRPAAEILLGIGGR
jgi:hypothetical protein